MVGIDQQCQSARVKTCPRHFPRMTPIRLCRSNEFKQIHKHEQSKPVLQFMVYER